MGKTESRKMRFGLVGRNISYSFSKGYFTQKFADLRLEGYSYENFDLEEIDELKNILGRNKNIAGLNVTIPYKELVIPHLHEIDWDALKIGAVNTIKIIGDKLKGFNTDVYGFQKAIEPFLKEHHENALILGTGGASKAVAFVFKKLGINYRFVSRKAKIDQFSYLDLNKEILQEYTILVNCSPLGTYPNIEDKPLIPYQFLSQEHLLFDLVYNPSKTAFLKEGESHGASICNGLTMLELQAEKAWEIWNS